MLQPIQKKIVYVFLLLVILELVAVAANISCLQLVVKPLLIPALFVLLAVSKTALPGKQLLLYGLVFSWLGDVLLMFEDRHVLFFIFGLVSFLTTHVFYILYFLQIKSQKSSWLKKRPILIALVLAYGVTLVWQLFPYLGDLAIPVIIYAAVICTMLLCCLHIVLKVNKKAAGFYLIGATAFVISDSLLAINKFYQPFALAGLFIMLTYCAAQFFIIRGFIEQDNA